MNKILCALMALFCLTACGAKTPPASDVSRSPAVSQSRPMEPDVPETPPAPPTAREQARAVLEDLSEEELLGQLFFVRSPGDWALAAQWAADYHLGGYILFGRDFKESDPDRVRSGIAACQEANPIPMLIGVDEEGGTVVRASRYPQFREKKFQSPQSLFAQGGMGQIEQDAAEKSTFLKELGINVNLAPVCDLSTDPNDFIYDRSFGQDAQATSEYVATVVGAMTARSMGSVLKHFPGYGNNVDTHTGIALDRRPLETFRTQDLLPFEAGISAGAGSVLMSHNIVACLDERLPASLSPAAYELLRNTVGFDGVAMTDDLDMDAVADYVADGRAVVQALSAGADLVLTSDPAGAIAQVKQGLETGVLSWERLREAALRVLTWKVELNLWEQGKI